MTESPCQDPEPYVHRCVLERNTLPHPYFPHTSSQESLYRDATREGTSAYQLTASIAAPSCKINSLCFSVAFSGFCPSNHLCWLISCSFSPSLNPFQPHMSPHCLQILAPIVFPNCTASFIHSFIHLLTQKEHNR